MRRSAALPVQKKSPHPQGEITIEILYFFLILTTFLCSLVAGFLFAFSVVVMPGIKNLNDREFLKSFQVMDHIIQGNQPVFIFVWAGSVLAFIASIISAWFAINTFYFIALIVVFLIYFVGVQIPTIVINVPLNNKIQSLTVDELAPSALKTARDEFENKWNKSNIFRSVMSCLATISLIILLLTI